MEIGTKGFGASIPARSHGEEGLAGGLFLQATESQHWTIHTFSFLTFFLNSSFKVIIPTLKPDF